MKKKWYRYAWFSLRLAGRHEEALEIAREYGLVDYGRAVGDICTSLLDLRRYEEAERLRGDNPDGRITQIWLIALEIASKGQYEEALPYFLRSLSFARLPQESRFLVGYIECLLRAKRYDEARITTQYWLENAYEQRPKLRPSLRRYLELMAAMAEDGLTGDAVFTGIGHRVAEFLKSACHFPSVKRCLRVIAGQPVVAGIYDSLEQIIIEYRAR